MQDTSKQQQVTCSVLVAIGFKRTVHAHANVVGLLEAQLGHHAAESLHHAGRYLLVELLGQHLYRNGLLARVAGEICEALLVQMDLCEHLVGERSIHDA